MPDLDPHAIARDLAGRLQRAWNEGDGAAFGDPFAADADFVNVRGEHHQGRETIAAGHDALFASIYRDSRVRYEVIRARALTDEVILAHLRAVLAVPAGPFKGERRAVPSLVISRGDDGWQIASFHNTPVATAI